jgi:hypothetical protein
MAASVLLDNREICRSSESGRRQATNPQCISERHQEIIAACEKDRTMMPPPTRSQSAELYRRMDAVAREYLRTDEKSARRAEILKELSELAALVESEKPPA